ncbi:hypothetical protein Acr_15g0006830 [Actinidia rufa]|uniref:Uncharacterized protein n=1 Tax=Actinidia rufa TaxID=165716 RepID=A0A7J0FU23_9ERIC|nr:hypothetical protein Acr_15g0006830 [Actinidia rufa]
MSGVRDGDIDIDIDIGPIEEEEEANEVSEQRSNSSNLQVVGDDTESSDAYTDASTSESTSRETVI